MRYETEVIGRFGRVQKRRDGLHYNVWMRWVTESRNVSERRYVSGRKRASMNTAKALNWSPSVDVHAFAWAGQRRCLPRLLLLRAPDGGSWEGGPSSSLGAAPTAPHPQLSVLLLASSERVEAQY